MAPPPQSEPLCDESQRESLREDLECNICKDLLLDPVTLPCCGKSFCKSCLRQLLQSFAVIGIARCPGGCGQKMPFRLPPCSQLLQRCLEAFAPDDLARRREDAEEPQEPIPGGFEAWEEVAASQDLLVGTDIVALFGTPGLILGPAEEGRIVVKFDERLDFCHGCLNVLPCELVKQLPARFGVRIGQAVVAAKDLRNGSTLIARLGATGIITRRHLDTERVEVQFHERADGSTTPILALFSEVAPKRTLLGGYQVGHRVAAATDLLAGGIMIVHKDTPGVVLGEFSDDRLLVKFDDRADGSDLSVNLLLRELRRVVPE